MRSQGVAYPYRVTTSPVSGPSHAASKAGADDDGPSPGFFRQIGLHGGPRLRGFYRRAEEILEKIPLHRAKRPGEKSHHEEPGRSWQGIGMNGT